MFFTSSTHQPLVSFCIPVHNSGKYLAQTLDSIFAQTYPHFEVICVNDHSTDDSQKILDEYGGRVKVFPAERRGAAAARNLAFAKSKGEFIVFFDSDDLISPEYLSTQVKKAHAAIGSVVTCTWGRFYNDISTYQENDFLVKKDLSFHQWIEAYWGANQHMTSPGKLLIPRSLVEAAGLWNETLTLNDDIDFFARVFSKANIIGFNTEAIFYYRSGVGGLSSKVHEHHHQVSNWKALKSAIDVALASFPDDEMVKRGCANICQQFIYEIYPNHPDLVNTAAEAIKKLGGADFPFDGGRLTNLMSKMIGWKKTKLLKKYLQRGH